MKKLFLILVVMCSAIYAGAQENINIIKRLNIEQDIVLLENRITKLIKKSSIADMQGLQRFHIFDLCPDDIKKEEYKNRSFLNYLYPGYYYISPNFLFKPKKYIRTSTLITDSTGNLVATADARLVYVKHSVNQNDAELAKLFFDKKIDFAFYFGRTLDAYYTIKDDKISIIEKTRDGLKLYSWDQFIEGRFDDWAEKNQIERFNELGQNCCSDNVYCYLTADYQHQNKKKPGFHLKLVIYNESEDCVYINDFKNNIYHISEIHFGANKKDVFFWDLLTLSNKVPEKVVSTLSFAPTAKASKKINSAKGINIVIVPNRFFVFYVFLLHSPFVAYPKGFYKLCLFYEDKKNCIAETIIEIE